MNPLFTSPAFIRILPFALYLAFLVLASGLTFLQDNGFEFSQYWDQRWLYPIKIVVVSAALVFFWKRYTELKPIAGAFKHWLLAVVTGLGVFVIWINLDLDWTTFGQAAGYNPTHPETEQIDWLLVSIRLAGATLIVPIMEELFWRSFLMRWLVDQNFLSVTPKQITLMAFVITAILFGIEHHLWVAGIIAGCVYAGLYIISQNLWIPILSHAITNAALGIWVIYTGNWQFW